MNTWALLRRVTDAALDRTIALSFDRTGYWRHRRGFADPDLAQLDLSRRIIAITGANGGLGFATAQLLAARGAHLVLLCRSEERMAEARDRLQAAHSGARITCWPVDLSDWDSIDRAATLPVPHLDALVHNAGILPHARAVLPTGLESTLATNLVGPLRLTARLLPLLQAAPAPRVVHVSSGGLYAQRLDLARLNKTKGGFDGVRAYAQTKRAQVILTELLAARWGSRLPVHCMHPGWANTPGVRSSLPTFFALTRPILRTPREGADTIAWLAAEDADTLGTGDFWFDRAPAPTHLSAATREAPADREALWTQLLTWAGLTAADLTLAEA